MGVTKRIISALLMLLICVSLFAAACAENAEEYTEEYTEDSTEAYTDDYSEDTDDYAEDSGEYYAEDSDICYDFLLSCDEEIAASVAKDGIITVTLSIKRTGGEPETELTALQDEICYDDLALEVVDGSFRLSEGVEAVDMQTDDFGRRIRVSYIIPEPDKLFPESTELMSFDFRVIDEIGDVYVTQENFFVTTQDGMDTYYCDTNELVINTEEQIIPEYSVIFETYDGESCEEVTLAQGSTVQEPETVPVRDGYVFAGWYTDSECTVPYDFEQPLEWDMVLYAKWDEVETRSNSRLIYGGIAVVLAAAAVGAAVVIKKKKQPSETP